MTQSLPEGLDLLGEPVLMFDSEGQVIGYNDCVADIVGDPPEQGAVEAQLSWEDSRESICRIASCGEPFETTAEISFSTPDSRRFTFSLRKLPAAETGAVIGIGRERTDTRAEPDGKEPNATQGGQRTLAARERALRRAYDIIADSERSLDQKIHDMLSVVRETIGTDFATLSQIDGTEYIVEAVDGPRDGTFKGPDGNAIGEGDAVPLSFTNCQRVVADTETLAIEDIDADAPKLANRPVNAELGISCYLGTPVAVEGENYGTFCFYDLAPRSDQFTDWEITFVELLGNWVGYELERERLMERIRTEERERYETLVKQSSDGVAVVRDGRCVFANDRFLELIGRPRKSVYGSSIEQYFAPKYRDIVTDQQQPIIDDERPPNRYDVEIETPDGTVRTLELAKSRIEHDGEPAMLATFRDITDRKRREESIRALQRATSRMQTAETPEQIAEIAVHAARDALELPLSICWFYESDEERLEPVAATDPVRDGGYFEPLSPDQYEFDVFRDGAVVHYNPTETGYDRLETGVLLPLGDHGLLAAGQSRPTDHDDVVLDVARTLAEHTQIALDRIERTRELERTQARFWALTENTSYGVVTIDDTSTVRYASSGISDVLGYDPTELEGDSLLGIMPERFHQTHERALARYLREGDKQLDWSWIELPGVHKEGHEVPLGISFGEATVDGDRRFSAVIRDISEQKQRQQELREERAFTESIFAALPDVFYAFDEQGEFLRWNGQLREVTGYTDEEIASMHPTEFIAADDQEEVITAIAEVFEHDTTVTVEAQFETKDGTRIPYELTGAKLTDDTDEVLGLVGIGRDISERKKRQRRFEAVFDNTYQFTGLMQPDGTLIEANEAAREFGDLDRADVVGRKVWNAFWFTHSEDLQRQVQSAVERAAEGEFVRDEIPVQGSEREAIIDFSIRPVRDDNGAVTLLIPEGRDITELKEQEEKLRRERDHVRRTEELANVGGWEFIPETETCYWTQGTRQLCEVRESFTPTVEKALEFVHSEDRDAVTQALTTCRETGNPFNLEIRIVTAQGRTRWIRIEGERVDDGGTNKLRGVIGDITDRKEREQRLMVLNRILRHNLRNKLSVVSGFADRLETVLNTAPAERDTSIDETVHFTQKIKENASDLITLGEKARAFERAVEEADTTGFVAVKPVVSEVVSAYREKHPAATITTELTDVAIQGNAEFLRLAVRELIDNAIRHSELSDPTVTIETSRVSDEQAEIRIADDGPGIPEMERKTLTEGEESPLLHGSGLGLWTVNWLVTRIGGHISITDNDPTGTVAVLRLPTRTDH